ncbi:putative DNA binding domain-containing protein [candidate division KSB1 bacterium]|nr:putative DNA binding domain-containing protein [candidate division KSB1 bacterium]
MLNQEELLTIMHDLESDRIERTRATTDTDKFCEAICAFSNDFPNHKKNGYLLLGVTDQGDLSGLKATDKLLKDLASIKTNGNILPQPAMTIQAYHLDGGDVIIIEVFPALHPPARYKGKIWIRTGPSRSIANETEERILIEKRTATAKTFDARPCPGSTLNELSLDLFKIIYLPHAVAPETITKNNRTIEQQLAALRFYDLVHDCPTHAALIIFGINPLFYLPGAYLQYVKFNGIDVTADVVIEKRFSGDLYYLIKGIEEFLENVMILKKPVKSQGLQENMVQNYPLWALRELMMNAIMHRDYESNSPIYFYEFTDRIEILNPGGLYGDVRPDNFPNVSDYRNPVIAECLKTLGYVNRFNIGIRMAQEDLRKHNNPPAEFDIRQTTRFSVKIFRNKRW